MKSRPAPFAEKRGGTPSVNLFLNYWINFFHFSVVLQIDFSPNDPNLVLAAGEEEQVKRRGEKIIHKSTVG